MKRRVGAVSRRPQNFVRRQTEADISIFRAVAHHDGYLEPTTAVDIAVILALQARPAAQNTASVAGDG